VVIYMVGRRKWRRLCDLLNNCECHCGRIEYYEVARNGQRHRDPVRGHLDSALLWIPQKSFWLDRSTPKIWIERRL